MFKEIVKAENKSDMLTELLVFVLNVLIATFILRVAWNRALVPPHLRPQAHQDHA